MSAERKTFFGVPMDEKKPTRCIDDRPDSSLSEEESLGPQMPGGSIFPIAIEAIINGREIDEITVQKGLSALEDAGYGTGVHRGTHQNPDKGKSDCGFADRFSEILAAAVKNRESIEETIRALPTPPAQEVVEGVISQISEYLDYGGTPPLLGESLIAVAEPCCDEVLNVEGDHNATHAIINNDSEKTFHTNRAWGQGEQAFNIDINPVIDQVRTVFEANSPETLFDEDYEAATRAAALALFLATGDVLIPDGIPLHINE